MKNHFKTFLSMGISAALLASTAIAAPTIDVVKDIEILPLKWYYDYKTFNGSTCQPHIGSQAADLLAGIYGTYNQSNLYRWVSCPIMRDDTETTHGAGVTVYLNNAKGSRCYVYSLDPHGSSIASQSKTVPAGGKQTLSFHLNKSVKMGNYFMYCYLTPKGYVNSYKLKERYTDLNRRTDRDAEWFILSP